MSKQDSDERMRQLGRALHLIRLLNESRYGVTLEEMADQLRVSVRTVQRMRTAIGEVFRIDDRMDGNEKRFYIQSTIGSEISHLTAVELHALQMEVTARSAETSGHADALRSLLQKVMIAMSASSKSKVSSDLEPLTRQLRVRVAAGPASISVHETIHAIQTAIQAGRCIRLYYQGGNDAAPRRRTLDPWGLVLGPVSYLYARVPGTDGKPRSFRIDRMNRVQVDRQPSRLPADWDFDAFLAESFGAYHGDTHDIALRVRANAVAEARAWRFHPQQVFEVSGEELIVRFRAGGLRELAEHLFTWGDKIAIEGPEALRETMRERLAAAARSL